MIEIVFLKHHQIDKIKWDDCIENSIQAQVYAMSWYLDVVSVGWEALVFEQDDQYIAVFPLPTQFILGNSFLRQPIYCQQLGLFSRSGLEQNKLLKGFLDQLLKKIKYSQNYTLNVDNPKLTSLTFLTSTRYLNLNKPYQLIKKNYKAYRKRNLKKGNQFGIEIKKIHEIDTLIDFFKANTSHKIQGGVSETSYQQLRDLYKVLSIRGFVKILGAYNTEDKLVSASFFIHWKNKIIYLFSSTSAEGRNLQGNIVLIDYLIQKYAGKDLILDFESPKETVNGSFLGIDRFPDGFGAERVMLPMLVYDHLPLYIKGIRHLKIWIYNALNR